MYVIKQDLLTSVVEIKKSKFYTYIYKVENKQQIKQILDKIKQEHKQARHILYCYLLENNIMEASENKEPVNSMHKVLEILNKKEIKNILCISVRYFGGILLGASNLDKTYSSCIFDLLNDDNLVLDIKYFNYKISFKTSYYNIICETITKNNGIIISKEFSGPSVELVFKIPSFPDLINKYILNVESIN